MDAAAIPPHLVTTELPRPCPPPASARGAPLLFARRSAEGDGVPPGAAQRASVDPGFPQPLRAAGRLRSGGTGRGRAGLLCPSRLAEGVLEGMVLCERSRHVSASEQGLCRRKGGHSRAAGCLSSQNRRGRKWPLEVV